MIENKPSVHYINYLDLDKILSAQNPLSGEGKEAAHDEMLFIIIHQTYELWFKQIIHEIDSVMDLLKKDKIDEENVGLIVSRIERVNKILQILVKQIDVLETMTSLDFLDFRHHLSPASGFQSHQFRKLEVMLGLKIKDRHQFGGCPYHNQFKGQKKNEILELEDSASLFTLIEKWLERIPFLNMEDFNFISKYEDAVNEMMNNEISRIKDSHLLNDEDKNLRVRMIDENRKYFEQVFDENTHQKVVENGEISSIPSSLWTIHACSDLRFFNALAKGINHFLEKTPTTCFFTLAGLLKGPNRLNIVLDPIFFLMGATNFIVK